MPTRVRYLLLAFALTFAGCNGGTTTVSVDSQNPSPPQDGAGAGIIISSSGTRVVNGQEVAESISPQMIELQLAYDDGSKGLCSGLAIAPGHILTAAHCFPEDLAYAVIVHDGVEHQINEIVIHPAFYESSEVSAFFNDVAIVRANSLNAPTLAILQSRSITEDGEFTVYGFGLDEKNAYGSLKSGSMKLALATENHLLSLPFDGKLSNTCSGDSGGPAVLGFNDEHGVFNVGVVGLVSSGTMPDCEHGDITLFTNLQNPGIASFIAEQAPGVVFN